MEIRRHLAQVETWKHRCVAARPDCRSENQSRGDEYQQQRRAAQGQRSAKAIGRQIEEQPVMSLLVAFGVGFVASRMLIR